MSRFPSPVTPDMLQQWAHVTDEQITKDIADTQLEIEQRQAAIAERRDFIAFLHRIQAARRAAKEQVPT